MNDLNAAFDQLPRPFVVLDPVWGVPVLATDVILGGGEVWYGVVNDKAVGFPVKEFRITGGAIVVATGQTERPSVTLMPPEQYWDSEWLKTEIALMEESGHPRSSHHVIGLMREEAG